MTSMTTNEEIENKIKELEAKNNFLLKVGAFAYTGEHINNSYLFRTDKGNPYGMTNLSESTDFEPFTSMYGKGVYNYEEYFNLPKKGRLFYSTNGDIIHDGECRRIYGYLDHKNKTLVKMHLEYDRQTNSFKFI